MFRNLSLDEGLSTTNDVRMLETEIGAVNPDTFQSFVERAITGRWVENCQIWNTSEGKTCGGGGRPAPGGVKKPVTN